MNETNDTTTKQFRTRGYKVQPDEIQALLKACLDFGVEDIRRSGINFDHLFYNVQQQMAQYGDFHERKLYVLKQYYLKAMRDYESGKLKPHPPEARRLWGTNGRNPNADENDEAWDRLIDYTKQLRKSATYMSKPEIEALLKEALARNIETIPCEKEIEAFETMLTVMHAKKLFLHRDAEQLRQAYQRLKKRYRKLNSEGLPSEAALLWVELPKEEYSHVFEHSSSKESYQTAKNEACRICRACFLHATKDLFTDTYQGKTYGEIIQETINVPITQNNQPGTKLCQFCSQFVEKMLHFAQRCRESFLSFVSIFEEVKHVETNAPNQVFRIDFLKHENDIDVGETEIADCNIAFSEEIQSDSIVPEMSMSMSDGSPVGSSPDDENQQESTMVSVEENRRKFKQSRPGGGKPPKPKKKQCHLCGKTFLDLCTHLARHGEQNVECEFCHKRYTNPVQLQIHRNLHTMEHKYPCRYCGVMFYAWRTRKTHEDVDHKKVEKTKFHCDQCTKVYTAKAHLNAHVKQIHLGIRNLPCTQCEFTTFNRLRLINHVRSIHTSERPYHCSVCDSTSNSSTGYYIHFKRHKKSGEATQYTIKCAYCAQLFRTDATFEAHVREYHPDRAIVV